MPTTEEIQALADVAYASQTTGVNTSAYNAAMEAAGIDPSAGFQATLDANALLESYGYAPGSSTGFYTNSSLNKAPLDEGLNALFTAQQTAINEYGYIDSTVENLEKYAGKIDPSTGEPYKFITNDNVANAEFIDNYLESSGTSSTIASTPTNTPSWQNIAKEKYDATYDNQETRSLEAYGGLPVLENALQWAPMTKKVTTTTADTSGYNTSSGAIAGGDVVTTGGVLPAATNEQEYAVVPDSTAGTLPNIAAQMPNINPVAGTHTIPAETFNNLVTEQVANLRERGQAQAETVKPQTLTEKEAAGEDVSAYQVTQKLYRNPNTGAQIYITFIGGQPQGQIPQGFYPVDQTGQVQGVGYSPVTAGGNTFTPYGANTGGYIQGFAGEDGSLVSDPLNRSNLYGTVSFTDPATGQPVTQTGPEYLQTMANIAAQTTVNPAVMATPMGVNYITEATSPGTVIESTAGQTAGLAPVITEAAQVSDIHQANQPSAMTAATAATTKAASDIQAELDSLSPEALSTLTQQITGQTADTTMVSGLQGVTGQSIDITGAPTRTEQVGEMVTGTGVDQAQVGQAFGTGEVEAASVQDELAGLMQQFEGGETPAWAAGSMRRASQMLAARGLGASSLAGQAVIQAAMEAALPIAQIDAGNKQQMALFKAEQRAKFLQMDFDQAFQAKVMNAARVSEIANMNFNAEQQVALENSRAANTVNMQNLTNQQAVLMAEAAALSQLDMANLNNRQQAAVQNAQNFLQMDMANLNNAQQTAIFKAQQATQAMLSDAAAANAMAQFNATSENQTDQFFANLTSQVAQFNSAQANAINQFNAEEANAVLEFNSALQNQREMFNAQNYLVVAQANAKWRQDITTANTEAQNVANASYAKEVNGLTQKALDDYWQKERDIMSYAFAQSEGAADRALKILLGEQSLTSIREQLEFKENEAKSEFWSDLLFGDASFSDLFKIG